MVSAENPLISLVGALYESAAEPERWENFLRRTAQLMNSETAVLTLHDTRQRSWSLHRNAGLPPEAIEEYNARYGSMNPTIQPLFEAVRARGSWHGQARSLTGERKYKRSEYYNEFGQKYGSYWAVMGAIAQGSNAMFTLSVVRSERKQAHDAEAIKLMGALLPHLACVIRIHHSTELLRAMALAAVAAVDAVEAALIAVDGEGRVLLASAGAENILREDDGLLLAHDRLSAGNPREARKLEFLIQAAAGTGAGSGTHPGGSLLIHRETLRPLHVTIVPFRSNQLLAGTFPCALAYISDPESQPASRAAFLSSMYDLTPSECRLADLLLRGLELKAAADSMNITPGSARFVLKSVFRKTGTHRQPELIRFLLGLPGLEQEH